MLPLIIQTITKTNSKSFLKSANVVFRISPNDKNNISISAIKSLINAFSQKYPEDKLFEFHIQKAHCLTIPAQNCLLKILEESQDNKIIILFTHSPHSLLPTILSRCQIKKQHGFCTSSGKIIPSLNDWSDNPGKNIALSDQIISGNAQKYLTNCLTLIHKANRKNPNLKRTKILKALNICLQDLSANVNSKLTLDHFFFSIKTHLSS